MKTNEKMALVIRANVYASSASVGVPSDQIGVVTRKRWNNTN